jgi:hypothetical protein
VLIPKPLPISAGAKERAATGPVERAAEGKSGVPTRLAAPLAQCGLLLRRVIMSTESKAPSNTKKVFKETVAIYQNDLNGILKNPVPLLITVAGLIAFWLVVKWL